MPLIREGSSERNVDTLVPGYCEEQSADRQYDVLYR